MAAQNSGGGGVSAGAIKAGSAFVEFVVKDNAFYRGLESARKPTLAVGAGFQKAGTVAIGAGTAVLGPLAGVFAMAADRGAELTNLAARLGTTAEALGELGYAGQAAGVPPEEFADVAKDLQEKLSDAARGGGAAEAFAELG